MNSTVLAFLLLGASTCLNAQSRMFSFIRERCGSCHDWANGMGGVEGYVEEINLRLNERDPHIVGRLDGGELLLLSRFCKISLRGDKPRGKVERDEIKSEFSVEYRKPKDTISKGVEPFTPCELGCDDPLPDHVSPPCRACESKGFLAEKRYRALKAISLHCGRCHGWAARFPLILREREQIVPRIISGHGLPRLPKRRRQKLLEAFEGKY